MKVPITQFSLFIFIFFSGISVRAQITVSQNDILSTIGSTLSFMADGRTEIAVMPGDSGANQTWDFREIAIVDTVFSITEYMGPGTTPYDTAFPNANLVSRITSPTQPDFVQYGYNEITPSEYIVLGSATEIMGTFDTTIVNTVLDTSRVLPLQYEDTWTQITADTLFLTDILSTVTFDTTVSRVDAWGTVRLPAGDFECLRLREISKSTRGQLVSGIFIPNSFRTFIHYTWIAKGGYSVAFIQSQDGETNLNFSDASSFGRLASGATPTPRDEALQFVEEFNVYPNPIRKSAQFSYRLKESASIKLDIYDLTGRKMVQLLNQNQTPGEYQVSWTPKASAGLYLGVLEVNGQIQIHKFVYNPQ